MPNLPSATIPATQARVVRSAVANNDYQISVALPFHYEERSDEVWPVIYVLDGNIHFNMVVDMVRFMNIRVNICNELPDAIIVGIGYPVWGTLTKMFHQVMHLRMRDFALIRDEWGGLHAEVLFARYHDPIGQRDPFHGLHSARTHPIDRGRLPGRFSRRALLGHSMGQLCALHPVPPATTLSAVCRGEL